MGSGASLTNPVTDGKAYISTPGGRAGASCIFVYRPDYKAVMAYYEKMAYYLLQSKTYGKLLRSLVPMLAFAIYPFERASAIAMNLSNIALSQALSAGNSIDVSISGLLVSQNSWGLCLSAALNQRRRLAVDCCLRCRRNQRPAKT